MIESLFPYLLKASGILLLFFGAYNLFLSRETFYTHNRHFLLAGLLSAFLLPLFPIPNYIEVSTQTLVPFETGVETGITAESTIAGNPIDWLIYLYVFGVLLCVGLLIRQLVALYRIYSKGEKKKQGAYTFVKVSPEIPPFSFFHMIFYSSNACSEQDLTSIIAHEKAHCRQWHSIDILLSRIVAMILWFNPIAWLYQKNIIQNLEFMADDTACMDQSVKSYQYTLLKATGRHMRPALTNSFYNSLIKKRIVMLQQSRSKRSNLLKLGLILPALALFLFGFNTVDVYVPTLDDPIINTLSNNKSIEITINSQTTNEELDDIKSDLKEKGIDFSYTAVRNESGEIIDLEIQVNSDQDGKSVQGGSSFSNDGQPIDPVRIMISDDHGIQLFIGSAEEMNFSMVHEDVDKSVWVQEGNGKNKKIEVIKEKDGDKETMRVLVDGVEISEDEYETLKKDNKIMKKRVKVLKNSDGDEDKSVIILGDSDVDEDVHFFTGSGDEKRIEVIKMGDDEESIKIIVDGEEVSKEEYEKMKDDDKVIKKEVKVIKNKGGKDKNVFIMKDSDDEHDVEIIEGDGSGFMFIDVDGDGDEPLFIVDGKESSRKDLEALGAKNIATINVLKGDAARKKYGKKAKDGVVEVTTKKNKE